MTSQPAFWWERRPGLYDREIQAFRDEGLNFRVDEEAKANGQLVLRGQAPAGALGDLDLAVVYPGTFPHTRPTVYQLTGARLARHQNPIAGNYCLIGRSSEYWRPSMTAAELIARLPDLVSLVEEGGEQLQAAEDPQGEPASAYYSYPAFGGVIVPAQALQLPNDVPGGRLVVRFRQSEGGWIQELLTNRSPSSAGPALLVEVMDADGHILAEAGDQLKGLFQGQRWTGWWVRTDGLVPAEQAWNLLDHLAETDPRVLQAGRYEERKQHYSIHAAVFEEEVRQGEHGLGWVFVAARASSKHARRPEASIFVRPLPYSEQHLGERIPEVAPLRTKIAAVVGLGTLGAPLTRQLAQSQIGELRLTDDDFVDPATTVRWPGGLRAAGVHKVDLLLIELLNDHPFVTLNPQHQQKLKVGEAPLDPPTGWRDDYTVIWNQIEDADLVVDTTAEDNVSRAISDVGDALGVPQLYVYSVEGYGGIVARVVPGSTGCFHCLALHLSPEHGTMVPPPAPADRDAARIQPQGCDEPTFTAAAPELLPLVNQATRVAYSTMMAGSESPYGDLADDVFVLAMRDENERMLPAPGWRTYTLEIHPECPYH